MTNITVKYCHFTPTETQIVQKLMKINFSSRGCIDWTNQRLALYFGCSIELIKRIFKKLRLFGFIDYIRRGATQWLRKIKHEIYEYFDAPFAWVERQINSPPSPPSITPIHHPHPSPPSHRENGVTIHTREIAVGEDTVQEFCEDSETAEKIVNHPLFVPKKTAAHAYTYFKKNPSVAKENLEHLTMILDEIRFRHINVHISKLLSKRLPVIATAYQATSGCLRLDIGSQVIVSGLNGIDWKDFLYQVLKLAKEEHRHDQIISYLEKSIEEAVQLDIKEWRRSR